MDTHENRAQPPDHDLERRLIRLLRITELPNWRAVEEAVPRQASDPETIREHAVAGVTNEMENCFRGIWSRYSNARTYLDLGPGHGSDRQDLVELPGFALELAILVPKAPPVRSAIGEVVKQWMAVTYGDVNAYADLWLEDLRTTAWNLLAHNDGIARTSRHG